MAAAKIANALVNGLDSGLHDRSQIGRPIDNPQLASVRLGVEPGKASADDFALRKIVMAELERFHALRQDFALGRVTSQTINPAVLASRQ